MKNNEPKELDSIRKDGLRPQVVGCFVNDKKIFLFYDKEHEIWQFPQGGIDNLETKKEALEREMIEECGLTFWKHVGEVEIFYEDKLIFPQKLWGSRKLRTDEGASVKMKGKYYYVFLLSTDAKSVIRKETQFDDYICASYDQAQSLVESIYQKGKRVMYEKFLENLYRRKLIK